MKSPAASVIQVCIPVRRSERWCTSSLERTPEETLSLSNQAEYCYAYVRRRNEFARADAGTSGTSRPAWQRWLGMQSRCRVDSPGSKNLFQSSSQACSISIRYISTGLLIADSSAVCDVSTGERAGGTSTLGRLFSSATCWRVRITEGL
eukprot:1945954-Rhodomonas_salina.1